MKDILSLCKKIKSTLFNVALILSFFFSSSEILADNTNVVFLQQNKIRVSGTVTSESGEPIPAVKVSVKDGNQVTYTDFDGRYAILVKVGDQIVFEGDPSAFDKNTIEITNNRQKVHDVTLNDNTIALDVLEFDVDPFKKSG